MMVTYKLIGELPYQSLVRSDGWSIPFDQANVDFSNFKKQINADEAELLDADGNLMIDAKAFVATLP